MIGLDEGADYAHLLYRQGLGEDYCAQWTAGRAWERGEYLLLELLTWEPELRRWVVVRERCWWGLEQPHWRERDALVLELHRLERDDCAARALAAGL